MPDHDRDLDQTAGPNAPAWAVRCHRIAHAAWFRRGVLAAIVVAAIVVGLETYEGIVLRWGGVLRTLDAAILALFTVEIAIRLAAYGRRPWRFFLDAWNVFDFVIVAVCLMPSAGHFAAVVRLARVLRVMRLFTAIPRLQVLVVALLHAIPSIAYVGLLMGLLFYVYAVMGTSLFGANDPVHFGNLKLALLSLVRVITLEDWTDLMYIQMYGSAAYGYEGMEHLTTASRAMPIVSVAYFVSFVLVGTMITLNLFVGVVLNSMAEAQAARTKELLERRGGADDDLAEQLRRVEDEMDRLRERLRSVRETAGG